MTNAIGYTRLSQDSDTSIDRQKRHIREYAENHGLELEQIYNDGERQSGFDDSRPEYRLVRARVRDGDIGAVIVNDTRRLSRDVDEVMSLVPTFRRNEVELHTWQDGQLDLSDPMHAAIEIIQAASEHESKKKEIERAREAVQERLDNGYDHGRPRFGMTYNDAKTRQVPGPKFDMVKEVWELRDDGETYESIADEVGISSATVHRIVNDREWYEEREEMEA